MASCLETQSQTHSYVFWNLMKILYWWGVYAISFETHIVLKYKQMTYWLVIEILFILNKKKLHSVLLIIWISQCNTLLSYKVCRNTDDLFLIQVSDIYCVANYKWVDKFWIQYMHERVKFLCHLLHVLTHASWI